MQKIEFTQRTGIEPTDELYEVIENMYLNTGIDIDKDVFCEDYMKHANSTLLTLYFEKSEKLRDELDTLRKQQVKTAHFLIKKSMVGGDKDMINLAVSLIGEKKYIQHKLEKGYSLLKSDEELIISLINK